jgi:hypothetical protein
MENSRNPRRTPGSGPAQQRKRGTPWIERGPSGQPAGKPLTRRAPIGPYSRNRRRKTPQK